MNQPLLELPSQEFAWSYHAEWPNRNIYVCDLSALATGSFDAVYTGGHVAMWVSDLKKFYAEAARILQPGGRFIVSEYHPFRRVWKAAKDRLELASNYFARGPFTFDGAAVKQYEFQWTVSDYITAVMEAGCELLAVEEFGSGSDGEWEVPPVASLPRVLLVVGRKRSAVVGPET